MPFRLGESVMNTRSTKTAAIEPFWLRLRKISLYPLQTSALLTILVTAAGRPFQYYAGFIVGLVITLFISAAVYKYAAEVLINTANGRMEAPEGMSSEDNVGWTILWVAILTKVMIVVGFIVLPPAWATVAMVFVILGTPGAMMSAATDRNLGLALNPGTWLAIMGRLGWPYFVVAALCFAFLISEMQAASMLLPFLPEFVGYFVFWTIDHFVTIATFHLMGYLMYQYHDRLGWEVEARVDLKRPIDVDQDLLDQAEALVRDGNTSGAEEILREHIASRGASHGVHERYRKLLALRGDHAALLKHGRDYLNVLLAQDQDRKALDVIRDCLAIDAAFQPAVAEHVHRLAKKAVDLGMAQLALGIVSGFHRAFPKHADTPANYLIAARIMAEKMNQDEKAKHLLTQVRDAFPNHPLRPEVDGYLAFLANLAAPAKA